MEPRDPYDVHPRPRPSATGRRRRDRSPVERGARDAARDADAGRRGRRVRRVATRRAGPRRTRRAREPARDACTTSTSTGGPSRRAPRSTSTPTRRSRRMAPTIGLDIGGTKVLGVLLDADGTVLREARLASPHTGLDALVATGASIVEQLDAPERADRGRRGRARRPRRRRALRTEPAERPRGAAARRARATRPGTPSSSTTTRASRRSARSTYGAAVGRRHVLLVTLGTGIGGGFLLDGRMYRGAHNFGAEIGHFTVDPDGPLCACGERGHWESIASGTALGRMARELVAKGGGAAIVAAAGGDAGAVTGTHVGHGRGAGRPRRRARCSCSTPRTSRSGSPGSRTSSIPSAS